jgi:hypothetical protein
LYYKVELGVYRGELGVYRGELGVYRGELGVYRGELGVYRGELGVYRGELGGYRGELGGYRGELSGHRVFGSIVLILCSSGKAVLTSKSVYKLCCLFSILRKLDLAVRISRASSILEFTIDWFSCTEINRALASG